MRTPTPSSLSDDETDRLFHALADATPRDIVRRTLRAESSVSRLAADYDMVVLDHGRASATEPDATTSEDDAYYAQFKVPDDLMW